LRSSEAVLEASAGAAREKILVGFCKKDEGRHFTVVFEPVACSSSANDIGSGASYFLKADVQKSGAHMITEGEVRCTSCSRLCFQHSSSLLCRRSRNAALRLARSSIGYLVMSLSLHRFGLKV
jgi:hypothetical protein